MIPKLWDTKIWSQKMVSVHFWFASIGVLLYITAMWISGILQGLMWRAFDQYGNLQYSFVESVAAVHPFYVMRAVGGMFFLTGMVIMFVNVAMTIRRAKGETAELEAKMSAKMVKSGMAGA
jgi:cytochrome c oxidase cbb3-type subunit 1